MFLRRFLGLALCLAFFALVAQTAQSAPSSESRDLGIPTYELREWIPPDGREPERLDRTDTLRDLDDVILHARSELAPDLSLIEVWHGETLCVAGERNAEAKIAAPLTDLHAVVIARSEPGNVICARLSTVDGVTLLSIRNDLPVSARFRVETPIPDSHYLLSANLTVEPGVKHLELTSGVKYVSLSAFETIPPVEVKGYVALSATFGAAIAGMSSLDAHLRSVGYESPSPVHPVVGGMLHSSIGRFYYGFEGHGWIGGDYTNSVGDILDVTNGGGGLELGFAAYRQGRFSVIPLVGLSFEVLWLDGPIDKPGVLTPAQVALLPAGVNSIGMVSGLALLGARVEHSISFTEGLLGPAFIVGAQLGYRWQIGADPWHTPGEEGDADYVEIEGLPAADLSGPVVAISLGAAFFE